MQQNRMTLLGVLFLLMLCLTGCGVSSKIEAKPFDVAGAGFYKNLMDADFHGYSFDFQDNIQGQLMTLEVWQKGECTENHILWAGGVQSEKSQEYYLAMERIRDNNQTIGVQLRGTTYTVDDGFGVQSMLAPITVMFPQISKSYVFSPMNDVLKVEPGSEYILAFWDIGQGNGHKSVLMGTLNETDYRETIQESDYIILLKIQLFASEKEAEAACELLEKEFGTKDKL